VPRRSRKSRPRAGLGERELARRLDRLCRLAADVAALHDEHSTLKTIVETAVRVVGVPTAHLALVDRGRKNLFGIVSSGRHRADAPRARFNLHRGQAAHAALRDRKTIVIRDASRDRRVNPEARKALNIGSIAYVPLLGGGESFGLLILTTPKPHVWTSWERRLATYVAGASSVALQTGRLLNRLAETDGRLQSLIQDIPAIVYTCEVDFPYRSFYVGPQSEPILGYPARDWIEDPDLYFKLVHPDDLQAVIDQSEEGKKGRGFVRTEYRLLDRSGNTRWFRDEAVLVRDPAGRPVAWHGVLVEVTGVKEMESVAPPPAERPERPVPGAPTTR
jgi:PAS domain S-box-containing protein